MPITIGSNLNTLRAQRALQTASDALSRVSERLSSGQRLNRASDDAAGLSVASRLEASRRVFGQAIRNLNDGISALSIADQGIANLADIAIRQRELAAQAANGIFSSAQRSVIDREAQQLADEYTRLLEGTSFNGLRLLDGSNARITLQAGFGLNAVLAAQFLNQSSSTSSQTSGLGTYNNRDTTFNLDVSGLSPITEAEMVAGDFNNDGFDDVLVFDDYNDGGNFATIELYYGSSSGLSLQAQQTISPAGGLFSNLEIEVQGSEVYFSADGGTEGLVFGINSPALFGVIQGPIGGITTPQNFTFSTGVYDFNGDGFTDRITGEPGSIFVELQDTSTTISTTILTETLAQDSFSLLTAESARSALDSLQTLLESLSRKRSLIGAAQSRIATATQVLQSSNENYAAAESRIRDADISSESAQLTRLTILQQTAAAVLAQANVQPALALTLLR